MQETGIFKSFSDQATEGFLNNLSWLADQFKINRYTKSQEKEYNGVKVKITITIEDANGEREIN